MPLSSLHDTGQWSLPILTAAFIFLFRRYLKSIDKFNERFISAYLTAGNIKLLLLHDAKSEDAIRNFFNDCYELYIKVKKIRCTSGWRCSSSRYALRVSCVAPRCTSELITPFSPEMFKYHCRHYSIPSMNPTRSSAQQHSIPKSDSVLSAIYKDGVIFAK